MLDLALTLINQCINLVKRREEVNKGTYTNFVAPAFADFEVVHNDYLKSFMRYRDMIEAPDHALNERHPVMVAISKDSLYSNNLRSKLHELGTLTDDPVMGGFIRSIFNYIHNASTLLEDEGDLTGGDGPNVWRRGLIDELRSVFDLSSSPEDKKAHILEKLDELVGQMQAHFRAVVREHIALKNRLLKPK